MCEYNYCLLPLVYGKRALAPLRQHLPTTYSTICTSKYPLRLDQTTHLHTGSQLLSLPPKNPHSSDNGSCSTSHFVPSARDNQQTCEVLNKCSLPCHLLTKPHRCTPHPISLHDGISHQVYELQSEHVSWIKMELHYINLSEVNL